MASSSKVSINPFKNPFSDKLFPQKLLEATSAEELFESLTSLITDEDKEDKELIIYWVKLVIKYDCWFRYREVRDAWDTEETMKCIFELIISDTNGRSGGLYRTSRIVEYIDPNSISISLICELIRSQTKEKWERCIIPWKERLPDNAYERLYEYLDKRKVINDDIEKKINETELRGLCKDITNGGGFWGFIGSLKKIVEVAPSILIEHEKLFELHVKYVDITELIDDFLSKYKNL